MQVFKIKISQIDAKLVYLSSVRKVGVSEKRQTRRGKFRCGYRNSLKMSGKSVKTHRPSGDVYLYLKSFEYDAWIP